MNPLNCFTPRRVSILLIRESNRYIFLWKTLATGIFRIFPLIICQAGPRSGKVEEEAYLLGTTSAETSFEQGTRKPLRLTATTTRCSSFGLVLRNFSIIPVGTIRGMLTDRFITVVYSIS